MNTQNKLLLGATTLLGFAWYMYQQTPLSPERKARFDRLKKGQKEEMRKARQSGFENEFRHRQNGK